LAEDWILAPADRRANLVCDDADVVDQAVIAARDRHEARILREAPRRLPTPPDLTDELVGHALVVFAHHDRHTRHRRLLVDVERPHLLEEPAVDLELPIRAVVEDGDRLLRGQLLRPPSSEAERWGDEHQRRAGPPSRHGERDQRTEGAPDDDRGRSRGGGPKCLAHHRLEVEPLERGPVQVRRDDLDLIRRQRRPQKGDLPPCGRRGEAVEVEEGQSKCLD